MPISKYDLLKIIKQQYGKTNEIECSEELVIDRSLDGSSFVSLTGYNVPSWDKMIRDMKIDFNEGF
jgi:dTDP-4-dehydrorhamnose reductase